MVCPSLQQASAADIILIANSSDGGVGESVRLGSSTLGLNSESGQTNDFKIGIHSFSAGRSALKGQCAKQARKFTCCAVGKGAKRDPPFWCGIQMAGSS